MNFTSFFDARYDGKYRRHAWHRIILALIIRCHVWHRFLTPCLESKIWQIHTQNKWPNFGKRFIVYAYEWFSFLFLLKVNIPNSREDIRSIRLYKLKSRIKIVLLIEYLNEQLTMCSNAYVLNKTWKYFSWISKCWDQYYDYDHASLF